MNDLTALLLGAAGGAALMLVLGYLGLTRYLTRRR